MTIDSRSKVLAIIPARAGSKGIPRKNLLTVAGKPLVAWTIEAVAEAVARMRCVVSTDDEDVASLALELGVEVIRRPAELATDEAPTEPSLIHAMDYLADRDDYTATEVLLLQPTSPVRRRGTIDSAILTFRDMRATSLVGVVEEPPFLWRGPSGSPTPLYDIDARPRRQDLSDSQRCYRETGSIYITTPDALRSSGNRISGDTVLFVLSNEEGDDIDTWDDVSRSADLLGVEPRATGS